LPQPEHDKEAVERDTLANTPGPDATPSPERVVKSKSKGTSAKRKRKTVSSEGAGSETEHSIAGSF
jgi:hypothetical protein